MSDLQRKVFLESKKTVSRKARTRAELGFDQSHHKSPGNSRAGSRANSTPNSRPGSRYASENEDDDEDDDEFVTTSPNSEDDLEDVSWAGNLNECLDQLKDRKRNAESRKKTLRRYLATIRHHFSGDQIGESTGDIVPSLLRSVREGTVVEERLLALKALTVTLLTCPSERFSDLLSSTLRNLCRDAEEESVKAEAIYALMIAATFGGGAGGSGEELLDFLFEIIESDGESVGARDSGLVVTAALRAWGFVASCLDDLADRSEHVMDAFIEQLDSTDPEVQSSAGTNIAFLLEAARDDEEEVGEDSKTQPAMQHTMYRIMTRMGEIARDSSKTISRKDRKQLRSNFNSIVTSIERGVGPGYSTAGRPVDLRTGGRPTGGYPHGFAEFGYQETLRVQDELMVIDTWLLHVRVEALKMLLGGGLGAHLQENDIVHEMLKSGNFDVVTDSLDREFDEMEIRQTREDSQAARKALKARKEHRKNARAIMNAEKKAAGWKG